MKKTISLTHPKIKYPRLIEAAKSDIRKYIKRERKRELPEGSNFWDFDCRFGDTEAEAEKIHVAEINKRIDDIAARNLTSFYVEVLRKEAVRQKKPKPPEEKTASS
jgi:hypothetical protein